jgi:hypothetical protein
MSVRFPREMVEHYIEELQKQRADVLNSISDLRRHPTPGDAGKVEDAKHISELQEAEVKLHFLIDWWKQNLIGT